MIDINNLGIIEYKIAWERQQQLFEQVQKGNMPSTILVCEHPHVYTLGKSGKKNNLLISEEFLTSIDATFCQTDRGGDITYHGYGQIVAYPILNLKELNFSLREYIYALEQSVINTLSEFGVAGKRVQDATGVWTDAHRKICAIGVKASRNTTMHGLALNVTTDLRYFSHINPCGFKDKSATSLEQELLERDYEKQTLDNIPSRNIIHNREFFISRNLFNDTLEELIKQLLSTLDNTSKQNRKLG